jgi:hypothetical protein
MAEKHLERGSNRSTTPGAIPFDTAWALLIPYGPSP